MVVTYSNGQLVITKMTSSDSASYVKVTVMSQGDSNKKILSEKITVGTATSKSIPCVLPTSGVWAFYIQHYKGDNTSLEGDRYPDEGSKLIGTVPTWSISKSGTSVVATVQLQGWTKISSAKTSAGKLVSTTSTIASFNIPYETTFTLTARLLGTVTISGTDYTVYYDLSSITDTTGARPTYETISMSTAIENSSVSTFSIKYKDQYDEDAYATASTSSFNCRKGESNITITNVAPGTGFKYPCYCKFEGGTYSGEYTFNKASSSSTLSSGYKNGGVFTFRATPDIPETYTLTIYHYSKAGKKIYESSTSIKNLTTESEITLKDLDADITGWNIIGYSYNSDLSDSSTSKFSIEGNTTIYAIYENPPLTLDVDVDEDDNLVATVSNGSGPYIYKIKPGASSDNSHNWKTVTASASSYSWSNLPKA
jgi:hypothetical protein